MKINIFISYSQEDFRGKGRKLWNYLSKHVPDSHIYIDQSKSKGQDWRTKNDSELLKSDIVLVILTPAAIDSPEVQREVKLAQENKKIIVPCTEDPEFDWKNLPLNLGNLDGISYDDTEDLMIKLHKEIEKIRKEFFND